LVKINFATNKMVRIKINSIVCIVDSTHCADARNVTMIIIV